MKSSKHPMLVGVFTLAVSMACVALALSPALVWADDGFEAARGRYEFGKGHVMYLGGTARRPTLTDDDGSVLALAPLKDGTTATAPTVA